MTDSYAATLSTGNGSGFFVTANFTADGEPQEQLQHEGIAYRLVGVDREHGNYIYDPEGPSNTPRAS
jgi:hypothetical protein